MSKQVTAIEKRSIAVRISSRVYRSEDISTKRHADPSVLVGSRPNAYDWKSCLCYGWYVAKQLLDNFKMDVAEIEVMLIDTSGDVDMLYKKIDEVIDERIRSVNMDLLQPKGVQP